MSDPLAQSFSTQIQTLSTFIKSQWVYPSPEAGFATYVFQAANEESTCPELERLPTLDSHSIRQPQTIAVCGYQREIGKDIGGLESSELVDSLEQLSKREAFPLDRQSFTFRPLEVLGVVLALKHFSVNSATLDRLGIVVRRLTADGNQDAWSQQIYCLSQYLLDLGPASVQLDLDAATTSELALAKWLIATFGQKVPLSCANNANRLDEQLLRSCLSKRLDSDDVARAGIISFALKRTVSERIESKLRESWPITKEVDDAVKVVVHLCRRFPLFAKQLQQRRKDEVVQDSSKKGPRPTITMRDEYDVQDSLFALLKLYFDDVRSEEWAPSYAGGQSRMDFVLKREKIVIETKFVGHRLTQNEIAKQLAIDEKYYRTYADCKTLICFVYDPRGGCSNPAALENDASSDTGDFRVVVIVSPKGT